MRNPQMLQHCPSSFFPFMRHRIGLALLMAVAATVAGCVAAPPPVAGPGGFTPVPTTAMADLFPLSARMAHFQITRGYNTGQRVDWSLTADGEGWLQTLESINRVHYRTGDDGALLIVREDDFREKVQVTYDPPVRLPSSLTMGQTVQGQCKVTIRKVADGSVRESGTMTYQVDLLGRRTIDTPAGPLAVVTVRMKRQIRLHMASVTVEIVDDYGMGRGPVAQRTAQTVRALGLGGSPQTFEVRLAP